MFYYNTENLGEYTNNEKLAQLMVKQGKWANYGTSEEPYMMQSDNSGYVPKSEYIEPTIEPTPTVEERIEKLSNIVSDMNDALIELMFSKEEK